MIDLALWLSPLDGENPSGEDLRNDPRFHELERLAEPQVEVVHDERNKPSSQMTIPVDWAAVLEKTEELRAHGRDLRLLVLLTQALANEEGFAGLTQGLTLIAKTIETHWDTVHPALRSNAPPREAALRRTNALLELQNSQTGLLANLRQRTFFAPRGIGPISGRDLEQGSLDERTVLQEAASGLNSAEQAELASAHEQLLSRVRGGCAAQADQAGEEMTSLVADIRDTLTALDAIGAALKSRLEAEVAVAPELRKFMERVLTTLERTAASRNSETADLPATPEVMRPNGQDQTAAAANTGGSAPLPSRINSREDVVKCLDLVIAFYDRTEPSSPIPHLARRIRRMVPMDFLELMEDLAPSGLKEFRLLAGTPDNRKTAQKDER
ncbi:type VI secretion system protein TssA [Chelativorans salis]|uniref:Type VI secretion system protein TssA n=1 Tax=Chelativorans salis TaxID=2978478 RepID=A0ABT2LLS6_9HYPH|nr:type VI secretion system protein TssA [Chelativorans sp. EGI FJ00035]MCT7374134.1 type VI secretion system protein TssA [Chelativorans sp. EGI FJ00035]